MLLSNWYQNRVKITADTMGSTLENLPSIKIGHAFSTDSPRQNILMSIHQSIDPLFPKFPNENFNLIYISLIIFTSHPLDTFPHHAESNKIETPLLQIGNIIICH